MSPNTPHGRVGRPPVTSRTQILSAARRLIDRDGWDKLTIRRLAAEIGIGATTLYHHVRDKEDLLLLLIREYAEQIPQPELPDEPRERIITAAAAIHDSLAAWPWAAEVLTTDGFIARLGDSALWLVEAILSGAVEHGCTPEQSVYVFRSIWYYTVGEILVRAHSARAQAVDELPTAEDFVQLGDTTQLPRLAALSEQWIKLATQDTFALGLRAFTDGLLAQSTSPAPQPHLG
ncbi:TetR/AcrR family transcriptional regulator [Streptomyces sp. NPDC089799]|uniref:TetR/AcrR family transcriptional regulator n=1 Tax=Streptomyces sp. NPDC089799 TaxID=3155066 RepID=UPI0034225BDA